MVRTLRQYSATAWMEAGGHLNDSLLFTADYALRVLRVLALLAVWRLAMRGHASVGGMSLATLLTYTVVSEAFAKQLAARTHLEFMLWEGRLVTLLLRPMGLIGALVANSSGAWIVELFLLTGPLLLLAPLLGVNPLPASVLHGALFVVSLALAVAVGLAVDFLFCGLTVAIGTNPWLLSRIRTAVALLFSGAMLPLAVMPWGLGRVFAWLPFASMASAPLRIYTGATEWPRLLALQALWAMLLWPAANWLWTANREKLVGYGG